MKQQSDKCPICGIDIESSLFEHTDVAACPATECYTSLHLCSFCNCINLSYARFCRNCGEKISPFQPKLQTLWLKLPGSHDLHIKQNLRRKIDLPWKLSDQASLDFVGGHIWFYDGLVPFHPLDGMQTAFEKVSNIAKPRIAYLGEEQNDGFSRIREITDSLELQSDEHLFGAPFAVGHYLIISTGRRLLAWPFSNLGRKIHQGLLTWEPTETRRIVGQPISLNDDTVILATSDRNKSVSLHMLIFEEDDGRTLIAEKTDSRPVEACDANRVLLSACLTGSDSEYDIFLTSTNRIIEFQINAGQLIKRSEFHLRNIRPTGAVCCTNNILLFDAISEEKDIGWVPIVGSGFLKSTAIDDNIREYPESRDCEMTHWINDGIGFKLFIVSADNNRLYSGKIFAPPSKKEIRGQPVSSSQIGPLVAVARRDPTAADLLWIELSNFIGSTEPLDSLRTVDVEERTSEKPLLNMSLDRIFIVSKNNSMVEIVPFELRKS